MNESSKCKKHKCCITAVIPIFKPKELHFQEALASILAQEKPVCKVILSLDDDSAETTGLVKKVIDQFSENKIVLLSHRNTGQSAARNRALLATKSEFIAFLDQDDKWLPNHTSEIFKSIEDRPKTSCHYAPPNYMDEEGFFLSKDLTDRSPFQFGLRFALSENIMIWPSGCVIRRDDLLSLGGFDENLKGYEDDDLHLRMIRNFKQYSQINLATIAIRSHPTRASYSPLMLQSAEIFYRKYESLARSVGCEKEFSKRLLPSVLRAAVSPSIKINPQIYETTMKCMKRSNRKILRAISSILTGIHPSFGRKILTLLMRMRRVN